MTPARKYQIFERLYGGDGNVYLDYLNAPRDALKITRPEAVALFKAKLVFDADRATGFIKPSALGRAAWLKVKSAPK